MLWWSWGSPGVNLNGPMNGIEGMCLTPKRNNRRAFLLLLLSLAAVNVPQATVLCLGYDGHVAIEPAGHNHGEDGLHACGRRPVNVESKDLSHVAYGHCRPCVDIPIPVAVGDHRPVSLRSDLSPVCLACQCPCILADIDAAPSDAAVPLLSWRCCRWDILFSGVILQV